MITLEDFAEKKEHIYQGGGEKAIETQHQRGKLTARERLSLLFDPYTFVEIDTFVRHHCTNFGMDKKEAPGEGVVTGFGKVAGRLVYAYAQDFTVLGGSLGEFHAEKIVKVQNLALQNRAPIVGLMDSGGARIQEGVNALMGFGKIFRCNTISSGVIPQISAIMGPCAGGAVYSPAITDFILMTDESSHMFITGPEVIKTVTGESITFDALGGAAVHSSKSGVAHFRAKDDRDCILQIQKLLAFLPQNNESESPRRPTEDSIERLAPELNTIVPDSNRKAYNMYDVIRAIVDDNEILDVQKDFARNMITCFAHLGGRAVGIIANQPQVQAGCMDVDASDKAARFIRTCDAFGIPLVTLVDVPGFLPGSSQEHQGIIRHGAKVLFAYSEATVPKVTLITRKAYGGAYIAMCSRGLGADMVYAWPSSEIAVMGAEGAANIVFRKEIASAADPAAKRQEKIEEYQNKFSGPYPAAEMGYIDDIIEPAQSRVYLSMALGALEGKIENRPAKRHGNIPL